VREVLLRQLNEAIKFQELVAGYMISKGYYDAYDVNGQVDTDFETIFKATTGSKDVYLGE
jgi:spore coat protein CotF